MVNKFLKFEMSRGARVMLRATLSIVVISSAIVGIYQFLNSQVFRVRDVEIVLQNSAANQQVFPHIKNLLDFRLKNLLGRYIWQVDLNQLLSSVEEDHRIQEAKVRRILPNRIEIQVMPYTTLANIMGNSSDRVFPIARDGSVMPAVPALDAPDGPILRGERFLDELDLRKKTIEMLLSLPSSGALSLSHVSEVYFRKKTGFELILSPRGFEVWLGFDDFQTRAIQAQRVADYLKVEQLTGRIIDARFTKKVVVKLRNEP